MSKRKNTYIPSVSLSGLIGMLAFCILLLVFQAQPVRADEDLQFKHSLSTELSSHSAGAHPDFKLKIKSDAGNQMDIKNIAFEMPAGFLGSPFATTQCTDSQAASYKCPATSKVGAVIALADAEAYL